MRKGRKKKGSKLILLVGLSVIIFLGLLLTYVHKSKADLLCSDKKICSQPKGVCMPGGICLN